MTKQTQILLILFIVLMGYLFYEYQRTVCDYPLQYDIGFVDDRFLIDETQLLKTLLEAEEIWEEGMGIELFDYKVGSKFAVNLLFDERQSETFVLKDLNKEYKNVEEFQGQILNQYETLTKEHDLKEALYQESLAAYQSRLNSYNSKVRQWNDRGGAPKRIVEDLNREGVVLKNQYSQIEKDRVQLNSLVFQINSLSEQERGIIGDYNKEVSEYTNTYGEANQFDQGEYNGKEINIYQFEEIGDLRLVLAHEFGHALTLEHVENPKSIMFYLMDSQNEKNPSLSYEDIEALRKVCRL